MLTVNAKLPSALILVAGAVLVIVVLSVIKDSIIEKYLKKSRYLMGIQELFYIFAA